MRIWGAREVVTVSRRGPVRYEDLARHADAELIVNTTPVGMYPDTGASPADPSAFPGLRGVMDVVYNPLRTALVLSALDLGVPCANGLYMLVAQAAQAAQRFTGAAVGAALVERVYRDLCRDVTNLVLIGMPGCGKPLSAAPLQMRWAAGSSTPTKRWSAPPAGR